MSSWGTIVEGSKIGLSLNRPNSKRVRNVIPGVTRLDLLHEVGGGISYPRCNIMKTRVTKNGTNHDNEPKHPLQTR